MKNKNISPLSDRCKEIILGSILGDGSLKLHRGYRNARFSFRHSVKQKEYFFWKAGLLKEISSEVDVWEQKDKDAWGKDKLRYQSAALESLTELYDLTHPHKTFQIRRKWLNRLTPLSLCIWWLDDGSLLNGKQGVLCTDGFSYEDHLTLVRYFRVVWKLNPRIGKVSQSGPRSEQYRLWFRTKEDLVNFLRIILPHFAVPSMLKKVMLLFKDPNLQQRWISEVCEKTGLSTEIVEKSVTDLKENLSRFRK